MTNAMKPAKKTRRPKYTMSPELAAYWAKSASASVMRDYATGNVNRVYIAADGTVTTIPAKGR